MAAEKNIKALEDKIANLEKERKQLLKLVSHDVKSPFNKLFALSNLLQLTSNNLSDEQLDYLARMEWVIKEGLTVVRNLLDLRNIANNDIDIYEEELNLEEILTDVVRGYAKQASSKKIKIILNTIKVTIRSDKRVLERVADNLISNAIKFTPISGDVTLTLAKNQEHISFKVSSKSGPLPHEEEVNLYKQSSPLSIRPTHGESALGNGLYIAQKYAQVLNGLIYFKQENDIISFELKIRKKSTSS